MYKKKISIGIFVFHLASIIHAREVTYTDEIMQWSALFALAFVALLALFISSRRTCKLKKLHEELTEKQAIMDKNQNQLLTTMSENIHDIALKTIEEGREVLQTKDVSNDTKEALFANVEDRLLGVTNDLISFLRLKSEKVEIVSEEFNINNVLNEVSGNVCRTFSGSKNELIFEIDKNVPRRLIGDSLAIEKILQSLLEYQMEQGNSIEVKLKITMFETHGSMVDMQFNITDTGQGLSEEAVEKLFTPYYNDKLGEYVGLGLFVSNELVNMMNGTLSVQSEQGRGNAFTLSLPLQVHDKANKRMYRLPAKELTQKHVLIVDDNYNAGLAIKKMFAYFRHEVTVLSENDFRKNRPDFLLFDIILLNQMIFDRGLVSYLQRIKEEKKIDVIALNSLLTVESEVQFSDEVIDANISKPLNQERIFELIITLYNKAIKTNSLRTVGEEEIDLEKGLEIHKSDIIETANISQESFREFEGKRLLIVEDNFINQKVLTNVLNHSGMLMYIANNGQEAVDIVRNPDNVFDIILMDINMPIMDGYAATENIRIDKKFDTIPIIAFTALVLSSEIEKMFTAGVNVFLSKPLNIGKLYTVFSMYLSDNKEGKSLPHLAVKRIVKEYESIDIKVGIEHSNHSEALYIEVVKEFSDAYGKSDSVFINLVKEQRYTQVKMLCVDIKGLTGAIGAKDMQVLVTEILQLLLYKREGLISNYIDAYVLEIKKLDDSIQEYLSDVS
jgi:CheY-like chemotaxis protein/signal transduction histidine kinase